MMLSSTSPCTDRPVLSPFDKVTLFDPNSLDGRGRCAIFVCCPSGTAVPVSAICLVVDFDNIFSSGTDDVSRVEHHVCDRVVVGEGVKDTAGAKIPDLKESKVSKSVWRRVGRA
jgi:hypothetical protein